ncbi:hypothetical protein FSP39_022349 [Pinctada imbricata]|uniref:Uncharacterized protein n=1 Tax=Pinctada imbricata TaxID=66713 RepID=A0AA88XLX1_PINIB|nr:hypothetical protein FSP39_022349 [Pinctada imbricata]
MNASSDVRESSSSRERTSSDSETPDLQAVLAYLIRRYLPNHKTTVANIRHKVFCGTYSKSGDVFLSASQDQFLRIYDTSYGQFKEFKAIRARDVGWSVLDTAFSPDGNYIIYSSWSDCIHLCNIYGDYEKHDALPLNPGDRSFAIFSLTFSSDNKEILGGANDGCLYVYDRESNNRILRQIDSHDDDVNAVAFADDSSHILFSGGDDGLVRVWDRRTLREDDPEPCGVMAGHTDGITYIDSKGDARYLITNSKDQTMKLWDMRKFSSSDAIEATKKAVSRQRWDYRWQSVPKSVYDILTGKMVSKLTGHKSCTRDVSWHPYQNTIVCTSWDGTISKWDYVHEDPEESDESSSSDDEDDSEDYMVARRRSKRLARQEKIFKRNMVTSNAHGLFE